MLIGLKKSEANGNILEVRDTYRQKRNSTILRQAQHENLKNSPKRYWHALSYQAENAWGERQWIIMGFVGVIDNFETLTIF